MSKVINAAVKLLASVKKTKLFTINDRKFMNNACHIVTLLTFTTLELGCRINYSRSV